jgi:hypothetical protein
MKKFATALLIGLIGLIPVTSFASLQGKWNVTEFLTIKTTLDKQQQFQAQTNQTTFTFNNDNSFLRTNQGSLLFSGNYKENLNARTFGVTVKPSSYNQVDNVNSIKNRVQANLAARGYNMLKFSVKTNKFTGKVFNESVNLNPLSDDVHEIQGSYSYTITLKVSADYAERKRFTMTIKVDSTFSGSKDATDTSSSEWAIQNKKQLWPLL